MDVEPWPSLDRLFQPRSIAIVGASGRPGNPFARPLQYLLRFGYEGTILPVNPNYDELMGLACYPSLEATGASPDLVLVLVPAANALEAVESCARVEAGAAVVFSSGFAEVDDRGRRLQQQLVDAARRGGTRVIGPNCQGVFYGPSKLTATFTGAIVSGLPQPSGVAYVGQSGAVGGSVLDLARERGMGLSAWVSVGNQADVTVAEAALDLARRDEIDVLALYLESIDAAGAFMALAETTADLGKRLVILRSGRTAVGQRAAASHTGALTPPGAAFDAVARRYGAVLVDDVDELLDSAHVMSRFGGGHGRRTVVLTTSGGAGAIAADHLAEAGLELAPLADDLQAELSAVIPAFGSVSNPVDVTAQLFSHGVHEFGKVCARLGRRDEVDQLAVVLTMVTGEAAVAIARDVAQVVDEAGIPVHLCWLAGHEQTTDARAVLRQLRIPVHDSVRRLAQAATWAATPPARVVPGAESSTLEFDLADLPAGVLTEHRTAALLEQAGALVPRSVLIGDPLEAAAAVRAVGGVAVCKVQGPSFLHKTELGLVELDVREREAEAVATKLLATAAQLDGAVEGILVEEQVAEGLELLVGVTASIPGLPPLLTVGLGGVVAELLGDVASDCLPLGADDVRALLGDLNGAPLLTGHRGRPGYDIDGAIDAILAVVRVAVALGDELLELEVNPLIVQREGGAVVADALLRLRSAGGPGPTVDAGEALDRRIEPAPGRA